MNAMLQGEHRFTGLGFVPSSRPQERGATDTIGAMIRRATVAPPLPGSSEADDRIRRTLLARIERKPWWDSRTKVFVQKGKVIYQGLVADDGAKRVARRIAEAVPGVCGVWRARAPKKRERQGTA